MENTERKVISKSSKRKNLPRGSGNYIYTEMVVYKTKHENGKFTSVTRHEEVKKK